MTLLFIGDIVGKPGRDLARKGLRALKARYEADLVIVNAENAAGGFGVTREVVDALLEYGADVLTSGNHIWDKKEALEFIDAVPRLLRPLNFPAGAPGRGVFVAQTAAGHEVAVVNAMGRIFMAPLDNPFEVVRREVELLRRRTPIVFVDFHAEATSEKVAMGWHLDGLATAVVGTHTHVQTADDQILPGGTAYITDVGMTGPHDSVIGVEKQAVLERFITGMPTRFDTATGRPTLHGVLVDVDASSGRAVRLERLSLTLPALEALAAEMHA
ncbi:MAG: TIGR00282 family metallophosphoesterase [Vicinamibacterales bacterium]